MRRAARPGGRAALAHGRRASPEGERGKRETRRPHDPPPSPSLQDGTLATIKTPGRDASMGPVDQDDWRLASPSAGETLRALAACGHHIAVLSNQGRIRSAVTGKTAAMVTARIDAIMAELGVPATVLLATAATADADMRHCRKPGTGLWALLTERYNGGVPVDLAASFFVGDAAGRAAAEGTASAAPRDADFSDSDKAFAEAVGVPFHTPDDHFSDFSLVPQDVGLNGPVVAFLQRVASHFKGANEHMKSNAFSKAADSFSQLRETVAPGDVKRIDALKKDKTLVGVGEGVIKRLKQFWERQSCDELDAEGAAPAAAEPHEALDVARGDYAAA